MDSLNKKLQDYRRYHKNSKNQLTHMIGVPAIMLGIMIFFTWIRLDLFGRYVISFSWLIIAATVVYYFTINKRAAGIMAIAFIIPNTIIELCISPAPSTTSIILFFALFVGGWVLQFLGHGFEKSRPAFMDNLLQLLIGPIFIIDEIAKRFDINLFDHTSSEPDSK